MDSPRAERAAERSEGRLRRRKAPIVDSPRPKGAATELAEKGTPLGVRYPMGREVKVSIVDSPRPRARPSEASGE